MNDLFNFANAAIDKTKLNDNQKASVKQIGISTFLIATGFILLSNGIKTYRTAA